MPGSLRFRLPALFLLGIVAAGVFASVIALRLFQGYSRDSSYEELGREARGIALLYGRAALRAAEEGSPAPDFAPQALELATGDQLFYVGAPAFPGQNSGLQRLPESAVPRAVRSLRSGRYGQRWPMRCSRSLVLKRETNSAKPGAVSTSHTRAITGQ